MGIILLNIKARVRRTFLYDFVFTVREARQVKLWSKKAERLKSFYSTLIGLNGLVFDIGANVGTRVNVFLSLGLRVVAVEPQRKCVRILSPP